MSMERRGTAVQAQPPYQTCPTAGGRWPAATGASEVRGKVLRRDDMRELPIRVQQSGGQPIHTAPAHRGPSTDPRRLPGFRQVAGGGMVPPPNNQTAQQVSVAQS
jgi:hypothetical protein